MKRNYVIGIAASALSLILLACSSNDANKKQAEVTAPEAKLVDTSSVKSMIYSELIQFTGTVESEVKNNIMPQMGNRIVRLRAEVGDRVGRGQVLAELDPNQLNQAKVQLDNARINFDRIDKLYQIGGVAKQQWDAQKAALDVAQTAYNNLLENTQLRSPVSGVVTARNYDNGDMANPALPIYIVEQISPVKLRINVSERYFNEVKKGMPVSITVDALAGRDFQGFVSLVYPSIDALSHTFGVEVQVPNKDLAIRPGMYARAEMRLDEKPALMVADKAVIRQVGSGEFFVFVVKEGKAIHRMVEVGGIQDSNYQVLSGLELGEVVVSAGMSGLNDGNPVTINTAK